MLYALLLTLSIAVLPIRSGPGPPPTHSAPLSAPPLSAPLRPPLRNFNLILPRQPHSQGHHSVSNVAKIKPAIYDMLKAKGLRYTPDVPNPGCVTVHLGTTVVTGRGGQMEE